MLYRFLIAPIAGLSLSFNVAAVQTCNDNMPASTPTDQFTINGDGTVTDTHTGLIWKRCPEGQSGSDCSQGVADDISWDLALQQADSSSFAGNGDWRLPNIKELTSIVELQCYDPTINLTVFPNDPGSIVWSGSPYAFDSEDAWCVVFDQGDECNARRSSYRHVRLVRGGQ